MKIIVFFFLGLFVVVSAQADCNSVLELNHLKPELGLQLNCFSISAESLSALDIRQLNRAAHELTDHKTYRSKYIHYEDKELTAEQNNQIQLNLYLKLIIDEPSLMASNYLLLRQEELQFSQNANDCGWMHANGLCAYDSTPSYKIADSYVLKYQKIKVFVQKKNNEFLFISNQLSKDELSQFSIGLFENLNYSIPFYGSTEIFGLMSGISTVLEQSKNKSLQFSFSLMKFSKNATFEKIPKVRPIAMLVEFGDDVATAISNSTDSEDKTYWVFNANDNVGRPESKIPEKVSNKSSYDYLDDPCGPVLRQFNEDSCLQSDMMLSEPGLNPGAW